MAVDGVTRASDRDRDQVVEVLGEQTAQGRLTLAEFEERTQRVYAARTWPELRALVADLPVRVGFVGESPDPRVVTPPERRPWPVAARRAADRLRSALPCLLLIGAVVALAFHLPFAVVIPFLIAARVTRGGPFRTMRGYRRHGGHRPRCR